MEKKTTLIIIASRINLNSPLDCFLVGLANENYNFRVICNFNEGRLKDKRITEVKKNGCISVRLAKLGIILTRYDWINYSFERFALKFFTAEKRNNSNTKIILMPFLSMGDFSALQIAHKIKNRYGFPMWIHTVDPLPSVSAWGEKEVFRKAVIRTLQPAFNTAELFSANNPFMTKYQVNLMSFKGNFFTHYTINSLEKKLQTSPQNKSNIVFMYAGSFYGKRQPDMLIYGFSMAVERMGAQKITLKIFGKNSIELEKYNLSEEILKQIEIKGFSKNIKEELFNADVLIDVDANISNDVFMSGKIVEYLAYNKPLVILSPEGSPTRSLFENYGEEQGVFMSSYQQEELFFAIKKASFFARNVKFKLNRESVLNRFKSETVLQLMDRELNKLL